MKNSVILFILFFASISSASVSANPNSETMKALVRQNTATIQNLMEEDQGMQAILIDPTTVRCLGLEYPASPIGVCLINAKVQDDSFFYFYSVTISLPEEDSENSDAYEFSVKLIEKAQN